MAMIHPFGLASRLASPLGSVVDPVGRSSDRRLWRDRRGAALIEYTLLIGLITLTIMGAVIATGSWAPGMWVNFLSGLGP
jgi:pilus assembly protein Flp/PilA